MVPGNRGGQEGDDDEQSDSSEGQILTLSS